MRERQERNEKKAGEEEKRSCETSNSGGQLLEARGGWLLGIEPISIWSSGRQGRREREWSDGFGSFGDGWLERRGSGRIPRGDLVGSAAAGEGTKSLDFRVRQYL